MPAPTSLGRPASLVAKKSDAALRCRWPGVAQLAVLRLELGDPLRGRGRRTLPAAAVDVGPLQPAPQRPGPDAELPRHSCDHAKRYPPCSSINSCAIRTACSRSSRRIPPRRRVLSQAPSSLPREWSLQGSRADSLPESRPGTAMRSAPSSPRWRSMLSGRRQNSCAPSSTRSGSRWPRSAGLAARRCLARRPLALAQASSIRALDQERSRESLECQSGAHRSAGALSLR